MISIAGLITCHNRKEKTINCLKAFKAQEGVDSRFNLEIFLVDDGSTDGTAEAIIDLFPEVKIINGSGNLYWNRGMHLAWSTAADSGHFDYFIWLNDDTTLYVNAVNDLLDISIQSAGNAIVCGAICSPTSGSFTYGGHDKTGNPILPNADSTPIHTMNGNCVLINDRIYKQVGNLNPLYPHAIGDYDYALRTLRKGFSIFTTARYIGECERNEKLPGWCYAENSLKKRIKLLYSPLGNSHPYYFFIYERQNFGFLQAAKHYLTIHLRVLLPSLWL